jgi:hypothetical protein
LRIFLVLSILFFFIGATKQYLLPGLIFIIGLCFPLIWDRYIEPPNQRRIKKLKGNN